MPAAATKSLQELREERENLKKEVLELRKAFDANKQAGKKGDELWGGPESRTRFDAIEKRKSELDAEIKDIEGEQRLAQLDFEERNDPTPPRYVNGINHQRENFEERAQDRRLLLRAWTSNPINGHVIDKRTREACERHQFNPGAANIEAQFSDTHEYRAMRAAFERGRIEEFQEKRALSALQPTAGGALIGTHLLQQLEVNMLYYGTIEQISELIMTDSGEDIAWPSADDTGNEGTIIGEGQAQSTTNDPSFKRFRLGAYDFSSDIIKVNRNLLTDPGYDVGSEITKLQAERIARKFNRKATVGLGGANEPYGYITSASAGKTAASSSAVTRKEIIDLIASVDKAYRDPEQCRMVVHDLILAELTKLEDTTNRSLELVNWATLDGKPRFKEGNIRIEVNNHQDSAMTTGQKIIAFGNFRQGKVRRVRGVMIQRLVELYAGNNQVGFLTIVRQDYNVLNAGTAPIKYLKLA